MVQNATRSPWPVGFPDVLVHTSVARRDAHPCYARAKAGDPNAALTLSLDLLEEAVTNALREKLAGRSAILLPVIAEETSGFNAIPDAMAQVLGRDLSLPVVAGEIVQTNKVGHTRARAFQRLVTPAMFEGEVELGAAYVLIDDHIGLGGTLANMRGHVEAHGGTVVLITTLTESREAKRISLTPQTREVLWRQHGEELDTLWKVQFGYGIDCLTEVEALQLCRQQSVAAIEDFLAQAAVEARGRNIEAAFE